MRGNIRELENINKQAALISSGNLHKVDLSLFKHKKAAILWKDCQPFKEVEISQYKKTLSKRSKG